MGGWENPPPGGGGGVTVTDGTTTVSPATEIDLTPLGRVTDGGGGVAEINTAPYYGNNGNDAEIRPPAGGNISLGLAGGGNQISMANGAGNRQNVVVRDDAIIFRNLDAVAGGTNVVMLQLPAADPHVVGQLYVLLGVLKVSAG